MNFSLGNSGQRWQEFVYRWLISYGPTALVATVWVLLAGRLVRLISRYAVNLFYLDEWDLKRATLFEQNSLWRMFTWQHGWHRLGLGPLIEKTFEPHFHWNGRVEPYALAAIVAAAAICSLWLKMRLNRSLSIFDIVISAIFFTPAQWETLYGIPIFSQGPVPFLLIVVYCLAWTCRKRALRYPLVLLINFVTIYTGFGLFLGVLTPVLLGLDYWSQAPSTRLTRSGFIAALLIAVASLASFFPGYVPMAGVTCFSFQPSSPKSYVVFLALIEAQFFALRGTDLVPRFAGVTVLVILLISLTCAVWSLLRNNDTSGSESERTRRLIVTALVALSIASCLTIAYLRLCVGLEAAKVSRYAVYVQIGILGLYFHLLSIRQPVKRRLLLSVLLLSVLVAALQVNRSDMAYCRDGKLRWKSCYLQIEDIKQCNEITAFVMYPPPEERTRLHEKLEYLKKTRQNLYLDEK